MKTVVNKLYNQLDQITIEERQLRDVQSDEVQIKIHAAAFNKADLFLAKGRPFMIRMMYGFNKPKYIYPGSDFSGEIIKIGDKVKNFKVGDQVFGELSQTGFGAFAEMVNVSEKNVWKSPKGYSHLEIASLPMPMGTCLEALKKADEIQDKKILIYGGSGSVGRLLVQLVIMKKAIVDVVASKKHHEDLKKLGVLKLYDYQTSLDLPKNHYDVIFGVNGYQKLSTYSNALSINGACIIIGGSGKQLFAAIFKGWLYRIFKKRSFSTVIAKPGQDVLKSIEKICNQTKIDIQFGKIYSLNHASKAYMDFEKHTFIGKYVIDMNQ